MSIEFLHQGLSEDGKTVKSLQQFKNDYSTKENQSTLYNGLVQDGEFDGSFVDFQNKYFPTQAATTTLPSIPTNVEKKEEVVTSEQETKAREQSVNTEFWETYQGGQFNREDFKLNEDGVIEKTLKDGTTTLMPAQNKVSKGSGLDNIYNELNKEEDYYKNNLLKLKGKNKESSGVISEEALKIKHEVKKTESEYNRKKAALTIEIRRLPDGKEKDKKIKELKQLNERRDEERKKLGEKNMPTIPLSYTAADDGGTGALGLFTTTSAVDMLTETHSRYGFTFSSDFNSSKADWMNYSDYDNPVKGGNRGDVIFITAQNGKQAAFDVDNWSDADDEKTRKSMDRWMRENAIDMGSAVESYVEFATLTEEEEDVQEDKGEESIDTNIEHKNFKKWLEENREDLPNRRSELPVPPPLDHVEVAEKYFKGDVGAMYDFMYSGRKHEWDEENKRHYYVGSGYLRGDGVSASPVSYVSEGDKFDTSRSGEFEGAITATAFSRFREENPQHGKLSDEELARKFGNDISAIKEEVKSEWETLTTENEDGDVDWDAIYNSEIYLTSKRITKRNLVVEETKKRVSDQIEGLGGEFFSKSDAQKGLRDKFEENIEENEKRIKYIENSTEVLSKEQDRIKGDGKTFGLEYEAKWLLENEKTLKRKISKFNNTKFSSQEAFDKAKIEVTAFAEEFQSHYDKYENLQRNQSALVETAVSLQLEATDILSKESDIAIIADVLNRNHQIGTQVVSSLANSTVDLLQGLATAAEVSFYYVNPFGRIGDALVNSGVIENEVLKTFIEVGQIVTNVSGASVRFDDDPLTTSMSEKVHSQIDSWQENNKNLVQEPPRFDDIETLADVGEWSAVMFASQAPQLALMMATGGQSTLLQGLMMAGTAGGQKFMGMEEQKKLYEETSGLYGENFGLDQIFFTSAAVGLAESLSERITFGQIKGVNKMLKEGFMDGAGEGVSSYLRKSVFTSGYGKWAAQGFLDLGVEGVSEVAATMSENIIDRINGGDNGIFDNIAESFISGTMISGAIKSPVIFNQMYAPFASPDNKNLIDQLDKKIENITGLISTGRPPNNATKEEVEAWKVKEAKYAEEILKLGQDKMKAIAFDIKRVNAMDSPQGNRDKKELLDIHKNEKDIKKEHNENVLALENGEITSEEFATRQAELSGQLTNDSERRKEILGKYTPDIVDKRYEKDVAAARQRIKERNLLGGTQTTLTEGNSETFFDWMMTLNGYDVVRNKETGDVDGITLDQKTIDGLTKENQEVLDNDKSSETDKKEARENIKTLESIKPPIEGDATLGYLTLDQFENVNKSKNNYGAHVPVFNNKGELTSQEIFINKATSLDAGKFYTASHELLHGILYQTLQRDPDLQESFGKMVIKALDNTGVVMPQALKDRINDYSREEGRGEEIMTLISEAHREGDLKLPKDGIKNFKNFFRNWSQKTTNRDISFDTDQDVINFIQDYSFSMKNNKENKAITKMFQEGAGGKLIADAKTKYNAEVKKNKQTKGEAQFSKNVDQELRNNPDLMTEIDAFVKYEDGTPKYTDKTEWQNSVDFTDAYMYVTQKKSLDGLIQAGMVGEGVNTPQALGEFTRKVKDELGERLFKNFDPGKNDSLFGWLTGVSGGMGKSIIYRAKGDVMVEYSKQIKAVSLDKGMTTEGGDTFSSQIEGEVDSEVERFDSEDLTIGKATVKKSDVDVVFLESVNADPTIVKSIDNIVENSGVNLEGLTYNGTKKNLVQHDGGKPKSKRKPVGPLYKVLDIVSSEFGVDGMRIIKEQDLTGTQRTLAREYINEHADKLIDMLPEGENRSGDATGVANTVLGEFYIKGDRISMAQSATGKGKASQTKRTDITNNEFIEFFNKPGTKSDGAIRALITQAATISANQAIRLNAINKESNPTSIIALVGDGKSAIMFSKNNDNVPFQKIGSIDRNLSRAGKDNFWTNINTFASENILDRNLSSIKIALQNTYAQFPEIMSNIDQIATSIHGVVKATKDPIVKNPIKLSEKLITSNENQLTKVQESSGSDINASEAFRVLERVNSYRATTTVLANNMFDTANPGLSIAKIMMMKGHLASMGKNSYLKRKQIFPGTKEFLANTLGKIQGIGPLKTGKDAKDLTKNGYTIKVSKDGKISLDTVVYNGQSIVVPSILSSQSSGAALNDTKSETKMESRGVNEDLAQETLNDIVTFYSDLFKKGEIDNVDLMMVQASLLSGMNSVLARAAKLKYISENAFDFKNPGKQVRYEHMLPRVSIVINMFNSHINGDGISNIKDYLKNYTVQIIPNSMDKAISDAKLGSSLLEGQTLQDPAWVRNYNSRTEGDKRLVALKDVFTNEVLIPSKAFVLTNNILNKNRKNTINFSKAVNQANTTTENTPSRGMSAFDFDETLIDKGENTIIATSPDGKEITITSGQWPIKGPKLAEDGYTFDFSDFVNVRGGVEGPLMQKFRNRIEKFGIENNYILTARPAEANTAIQGWLKEQGIDMPLENITGLGNSTGAAKAQWMVEKFAEGYNDMYFVDDALPNVTAVAEVIDQLDIKGKSVQAKIQFSKQIDSDFSNILNNNSSAELDLNRVLEQTKGVKAESRYSDAQAKVRGSKKGKYGFFVPPSAEDFKGLIYRFVGKGRIGEQQMAFFKKALFDPFSRANSAINMAKQRLDSEYRALLKEFPNIKEDMNNVVYNNFTLGQAIRVYNWNKAGFEIPGLSQRDLDNIIKEVEADVETLAFANALSIVTNQEAGYTQPGDFWMVENIQSDINKINNEISREDHLAEWKQNIEKMFGVWENGRLVGPNMNKIEAIYGSRFREALEDIVWRMEYGSKRQTGNNRLVNSFNNWANQSVGAIMFFNMRSALLQTISSINYLNWSDNNPINAGLALANVPQFIKDFSMIFNSDMLKQRRAGNQRGINEAELAEAVAGNKFSPKAIINWLLTKGFLPTQIADSFAIASGGGIFYRNRVNSLIKKGMSQADAEARAFQDFAEQTEESQQSSRPDMISQQQASPLGRYILAFKNTPMQYARLMKKAWLDIANGRGDFKTNLGKIIYYGGVQNLIFSGLQAAMGAMLGDEDEEKDAKAYERIANSMIDSVLGGLGFAGNAVSTVKNMIMEYIKQEGKGWNADHTYTILKFFGFSPTIGSKGRKLYSAIQTQKYNKEVIKEMDILDIDNPRWSVIANLVSALTNLPLDRLIKKIDNVDAAITEDISNAQRLALLLGWNTWDLDIDDSDVVAVEDEIKEKKKVKKEEQKKIKKEEKKKEIELEEQKLIEDNIEKQKTEKGEIKCAAINKAGKRCGTKIEPGQSFCTIHAKVEQGTKEVQCSKIKSNKERCKMKTKAKSGLCYYHD